jgi:hypothetical protein
MVTHVATSRASGCLMSRFYGRHAIFTVKFCYSFMNMVTFLNWSKFHSKEISTSAPELCKIPYDISLSNKWKIWKINRAIKNYFEIISSTQNLILVLREGRTKIRRKIYWERSSEVWANAANVCINCKLITFMKSAVFYDEAPCGTLRHIPENNILQRHLSKTWNLS